MIFNEKKFYELAKENGFEAADLIFDHSFSLSVSVFHNEVDSFTESDSYGVSARGIINGKFGTASTEEINKDTPEVLINGIKETARLIEKDEKGEIFKGSKKYHKKNVYNPNTITGDISKKIEILKQIEARLRAYDKRIVEVATVGYDESLDESVLSNSYGLKLKDKKATCTYYAEVAAQDGNDMKTGFHVFASLNQEDFNIDEFVKEVAEDALKKIGAIQCKSKKYPTVLNPETASSLLSAYLSNIDAEEVQKGSSMFCGKLHQSIASKKLTVIENPLLKNFFFTYHDDEGVAATKKTIINKGVLETYIYTLETAKKDGVAPTGNGYQAGKVRAGLSQVVVKPGKKSEEEIFSKIKEGVYITSLEGLHAGLNPKSGNFSLQAQGFMIKDGKLAEPLTLITVAGNLKDVFNDVKEVASNSKLNIRNGYTIPSMLIKKMAISGK